MNLEEYALSQFSNYPAVYRFLGNQTQLREAIGSVNINTISSSGEVYFVVTDDSAITESEILIKIK